MKTNGKEKYFHPVELVLEALEKKKVLPFYIFEKAGCENDERALSALMNMIGDEEVKYREKALIDLWMLQGSKAVSFMHAFLIDENSSIRSAAERYLSRYAESNDGIDINISFIEKAL